MKQYIHKAKIGHELLSKEWLLLDNQSTVDDMVDNKYLTNIHTVKQPLIVFCNAGSTMTNQKGMFGKFSI